MPERNSKAYSVWDEAGLRKHRMDYGISKKDMAEGLGVSYRMYCYYESGHTKIDKPLEYAVRWICSEKGEGQKTSPGTLTAFENQRIDRLLDALTEEAQHVSDEHTQKILQQSIDEIELLLSKVQN